MTIQLKRKSETIVPFNADFDLSISVIQGMEPALHQQRPLEAKRCDEEVETHGAKTVALEKSHQEAKAHKDHHMDILKALTSKRVLGYGSHIIRTQE